MTDRPLERGGQALHARSSWVALALVVYFCFCYAMAINWYHAGYFARNDLIFNTDPRTNLASLAHGWAAGRNASSHPLLEFFAVPVWLIGEALSRWLPVVDKSQLREYVALGYPPLFGSVAVGLFHRLLQRLDLFGNGSRLVLLVFALSFSSLLFSIVPETYAISSALLVALLYYYLVCWQRGSGHLATWLFLGFALTGVTVTNVAIFFFVYLAFSVDVRQKKVWPALVEAGALSGGVLITAVLMLKLALGITGAPAGHEGGSEWVADYFSLSPYDLASRITQLVGAFYNTFNAAFHLPKEGGISFRRNAGHLFSLAFVTLCVAVAAYFIRRHFASCWHSRFGGLLVAILAFNIVLHTVFGAEMFLYSQHWAAALTLLLAPVLVQHRQWGWAFLAVNTVVNGVFLFRLPHLLGTL